MMAMETSIALLPELDLFTNPPVQKSIDKTVISEHRPIATLSNSNNAITFVIPTSPDEYIQLRETLLHLKFRVNLSHTAPGTDITALMWSKVSGVNNLLHSIFKQIDVKINNKQITNSPQTYAYKAFFETLFGYTHDAKLTHLTASGWIDDSTTDKEAIVAVRSQFITPKTVDIKGAGKIVELCGKLHLDLAHQPRALIGGATLEITLIPHSSPAFYLMSSDNKIIPSITYIDASLSIHRSKVSPLILDAHSSALTRSPAKYPITRSEVKSYTISSGALSATIDNVVNGVLPRRAFIALVSNKAFNGDFSKNPFNFQTFSLNFIATYLDGVMYPSRGYQPDYENGLYVKEYIGLYEALNQLSTDAILDIPRKHCSIGNAIYGFDYAPDNNDPAEISGHMSESKVGSMRVDLKFATTLTETINVLVYLEYDGLVTIDKHREAATDFM
jgi:hypothetical protein